MEKLSGDELTSLISSVFPRFENDRKMGILVDIPRENSRDNDDWKRRREICRNWYEELKNSSGSIGLEQVNLIAYPDVKSNNADLPETAYIIKDKLPEKASDLPLYGERIFFDEIFKDHQLFLAPTEFSTTAPLKNSARKFGFRAATMPGFSEKMIPALRIDYGEVFRRVELLKNLLDPAEMAQVIFVVDDVSEYHMDFDLRFRKSHMSSGRFPEKSTAGNLPSGETYIVPYEGELKEKSLTHGTLPVQIGNDILFYSIVRNRAIEVLGSGDSLQYETDYLHNDPAYGNMAELGFGVLGDFGLEPINEILLDEKLGFHVAFGRSDHFGGIISPDNFSSPEKVIHLDRVYIPKIQPKISIRSIILKFRDRGAEVIFENGNYTIFD